MKITVTLTKAQAMALISAVHEVEAGYDPDLWKPQKLRALRRAAEALADKVF